MLDNLDIKIEWVEDDLSVIDCDESGEYYEIECGWSQEDETFNKDCGGWDDGFDNDLPHVRRDIFALISKDGEELVWKDKFEEVVCTKVSNYWVLFTVMKLQKQLKKQYIKKQENSLDGNN